MADDKPFRQERRKAIQPEDIGEERPGPQASLERIAAMRRAAEQDDDFTEENNPLPHVAGNPNFGDEESSVKVTGPVPPALLKAMQANKEPKRGFNNMGEKPERAEKTKKRPGPQMQSSDQLKGLIENIRGPQVSLYEAIELPSRGKFYNGSDGPTDGILNLRQMTGAEEQILATPRFIRRGTAINQIFEACVQENYNPDQLLTIDRTYMLIYLRGISYSPIYNAEVKCPDCEKKFASDLDLNTLYVESCPDDFGPNLTDTMPSCGYKFTYRLSRGRDETEINEYRERRIKLFGDSAADDTLTYRMASLLEDVEGLADKRELQTLLKNLSVNDVSYIRNCINDPPFGVNTKMEITCPSCLHDFEIDLPFDADFFFPRRKKGSQTQA